MRRIMDKLELEGSYYFNKNKGKLRRQGEIPMDFGSNAPIMSFDNEVAKHFSPKLPEGAVWRRDEVPLGRLKITIERVDE